MLAEKIHWKGTETREIPPNRMYVRDPYTLFVEYLTLSVRAVWIKLHEGAEMFHLPNVKPSSASKFPGSKEKEKKKRKRHIYNYREGYPRALPFSASTYVPFPNPVRFSFHLSFNHENLY